MSEEQTPSLKKSPIKTGVLQVQISKDIGHSTSVSLAELRERYLHFLVNRYEWIDAGQGIRQVQNIVRMRLEDLYTPISLTFSPNAQHTPKKNWNTPVSLSYETFKLVAHEPRVVILGDPGSGKTTLLKRIALSLAKGRGYAEMGLDGDWLPILIPIAAYAEALEDDVNLSFSQYLNAYFARYELIGLGPMFEDALQNGQAFLLLDGLDEAVQPERRKRVVQRVEALFSRYPTCRGIVTSREAGYWDVPLESFPCATFIPLADGDILRFARNWYLAYELAGREKSSDTSSIHSASIAAESLLAEINLNPKFRSLGRNPLLLTWLLVIFRQEDQHLPSRRVELYRLYLEGLSENWNRARSLSGPLQNLWQKRPISVRLVVNILGPTALWMVENGQRTISREELIRKIAERLADKDYELAEELLPIIQQATGILQERAPNLYAFLHPTLMEYLAARAIIDLPLGRSTWDIIRPHICETYWQEVISLAVAASTPRDATTLIRETLREARTLSTADAVKVYHLLGKCLIDAGQDLFPPEVWASVIELLRPVLTNQLVPPSVRCDIGTILGYLGEDYIVLEIWIHIPRENYAVKVDTDKMQPIDVMGFQITRHPITNLQYRRFVDDGGYFEEQFWSPAGWDYRSASSLVCPHYWNEALFKPNHPVVGISWFEAEAYCKWLTSRMYTLDKLTPEEVIRLPTEVEWEVAAGWDPVTRRILTWPWGDTFDSNLANTSEARIGGTSPVGAFLHGMSSIGAFDMAGNVWEWTSSRPKDPPYETTDCYEDATINVPKVLRGGAWTYDRDMAQCDYRGWLDPETYGLNIGFRCVLAVDSPSTTHT